MLLSLSIEQIGDAADDDAVHQEGDGECGKFRRNPGIHERLLKSLLSDSGDGIPTDDEARAVPGFIGALNRYFQRTYFFRAKIAVAADTVRGQCGHLPARTQALKELDRPDRRLRRIRGRLGSSA